MEQKVFPSPAVAELLKESFVEARLHTDGRVNIERIKELQNELARTVANPTYVVVEPTTGDTLGRLDHAVLNASDFLEFLEEAAERKQ